MTNSLRQLYGLYSPGNSPGQSTGSGRLSLLQGILPNPGIEPRSPILQVDSLPAESQGKPLYTELKVNPIPNIGCHGDSERDGT